MVKKVAFIITTLFYLRDIDYSIILTHPIICLATLCTQLSACLSILYIMPYQEESEDGDPAIDNKGLGDEDLGHDSLFHSFQDWKRDVTHHIIVVTGGVKLVNQLWWLTIHEGK